MAKRLRAIGELSRYPLEKFFSSIVNTSSSTLSLMILQACEIVSILDFDNGFSIDVSTINA